MIFMQLMQKINNELGWKLSVTFEEGLSKTIDWYLSISFG